VRVRVHGRSIVGARLVVTTELLEHRRALEEPLVTPGIVRYVELAFEHTQDVLRLGSGRLLLREQLRLPPGRKVLLAAPLPVRGDGHQDQRCRARLRDVGDLLEVGSVVLDHLVDLGVRQRDVLDDLALRQPHGRLARLQLGDGRRPPVAHRSLDESYQVRVAQRLAQSPPQAGVRQHVLLRMELQELVVARVHDQHIGFVERTSLAHELLDLVRRQRGDPEVQDLDRPLGLRSAQELFAGARKGRVRAVAEPRGRGPAKDDHAQPTSRLLAPDPLIRKPRVGGHQDLGPVGLPSRAQDRLDEPLIGQT